MEEQKREAEASERWNAELLALMARGAEVIGEDELRRRLEKAANPDATQFVRGWGEKEETSFAKALLSGETWAFQFCDGVAVTAGHGLGCFEATWEESSGVAGREASFSVEGLWSELLRENATRQCALLAANPSLRARLRVVGEGGRRENARDPARREVASNGAEGEKSACPTAKQPDSASGTKAPAGTYRKCEEGDTPHPLQETSINSKELRDVSKRVSAKGVRVPGLESLLVQWETGGRPPGKALRALAVLGRLVTDAFQLLDESDAGRDPWIAHGHWGDCACAVKIDVAGFGRPRPFGKPARASRYIARHLHLEARKLLGAFAVAMQGFRELDGGWSSAAGELSPVLDLIENSAHRNASIRAWSWWLISSSPEARTFDPELVEWFDEARPEWIRDAFALAWGCP